MKNKFNEAICAEGMSNTIIPFSDLQKRYPEYSDANQQLVAQNLEQELAKLKMKIVVLDDDPTGTQTVNDIHVYTQWDKDCLKDAFDQTASMFYVLTNSRSFSQEQTKAVHKEIAQHLLEISNESGKDFIVISRSDSTLRGYYPLEPETLKNTMESHSSKIFDGEIICPFFVEGGRYTVDNIHYVKEGKYLTPAGETEFARDKSFGYKNSNLPMWIEEKSEGKYPASEVECITLDMLRGLKYGEIEDILRKADGYKKIVVNAVSYWDIKVFITAFVRAILSGKRFIFRSAAAIPKVIGGVPDVPLLGKDDLIDNGNANGGLIIIGSHVNKTTLQFEKLRELDNIIFFEFNQHLVHEPEKMASHAVQVRDAVDSAISKGKTTVVYTRRERVDAPSGSQEDNLRMATSISDTISGMVNQLHARPSFVIAKGGITSSDIAVKGLGVKKAMIAGQILKGIPVWLTGNDSKFPKIPYVVFPGNVGEVDALKEIVANLQER